MEVQLRKDWAWDYQTGVRFINISPEDVAGLKNFLTSPTQKTLCAA